MADKPVQSNGKGNSTETDHGKGNSKNKGDDHPYTASPDTLEVNSNTHTNQNAGTTMENSAQGFDDTGYNRTARIFNGTAWEWCMEKVGDAVWCTTFLGESINDRLVMKWNAEWDRGNAEDWSNPPYDAWENNQWNGKVSGGSGDVWHYKIVWVGTCGADLTPLENGGYCIWGQFEVIMDHGTLDGVHTWVSHANPSGYGFYP